MPRSLVNLVDEIGLDTRVNALEGAAAVVKNYIPNSVFSGGSIASWSLFNTTIDSTTKIPSGSVVAGAAGFNALSATNISPLQGTHSLLVSTTAGVTITTTAQGFISSAFTIDREDQAKVMGFSFYYEALSGTMNFSGTVNNTFAVYIRDVSGGAWIQPAGVYNMTQGSGSGLCSGTFQTTATGTQYQIAVMMINTVSAGVSLEFDDFQLGPQKVVYGSPVTDWVSYTPTISPISGFTTGPSGRYRRVGDSYEVYISFKKDGSAGTGAGALTFSVPFTIDTSKIFTGSILNSLGWAGTFNISGANLNDNLCNVEISGTNALQISKPGTSSVYIGTDVVASSYFTVHAILPAVGLSSSVQMSNDVDTRVVAFNAGKTAAQNITLLNTFETVLFDANVVDTHGTYNSSTGIYTIPVSGYYHLSLGLIIQGATAGDDIYSRITYTGGVITKVLDAAGTGSFPLESSGVVYLNAGDSVRATFKNATAIRGNIIAGGGDYNIFSIRRLSGPATIAASETVAASYWLPANQTSDSSTPLNFSSKEFDSHNAVTTGAAWRFSAPISGTYLVTGFVFQNTLIVSGLLVYKNGSAYKPFGYGNGSSYTSNGSVEIKLNAGDYIDLRASASSSYSGAASLNSIGASHIDIIRVGN